MNPAEIDAVQSMFQSDIRSMINFIQLNQNLADKSWQKHILHYEIWEQLQTMILHSDTKDAVSSIHAISIQYNIDKKNILKNYFNHMIHNHPAMITDAFLTVVDNCIHNYDIDLDVLIQYFCIQIKQLEPSA
jgi:hypothetical protein